MMPVFGGILGIMIAITVTGGSSGKFILKIKTRLCLNVPFAAGAHINPAVTLGVAISGHLSWFKVPVYWGFQLAGCYVGSGIAFSVYKGEKPHSEDSIPSQSRTLVFIVLCSAIGENASRPRSDRCARNQRHLRSLRGPPTQWIHWNRNL